jgi:ABC-type antimicrobial peptide transport system permease subunit
VLIAAGITAGSVAAFFALRTLGAFVPLVTSPIGPIALAAGALTLLAALSMLAPARRAARIDPLLALVHR